MQGFEVQKGWLGHLGYWGLPQHLDGNMVAKGCTVGWPGYSGLSGCLALTTYNTIIRTQGYQD